MMGSEAELETRNFEHAFSTDEQDLEVSLLSLADNWLDLLAEEKFGEAISATLHRGRNGWSPQAIKQWLQGYGSDLPHRSGPFRVTDRALASGQPDREFIWSDHPFSLSEGEVIGQLIHTIPLNHKWSDLEARFEIVLVKGKYFLLLRSILVP